MKADNRKQKRGRRIAAALVGCAAAVAVAAIAVLAVSGAGQTAGGQGDGQAEEASTGIDLTAEADGWDAATSTPLIVHVASADGGGVDRWEAVDAQGETALDVPDGSYTLEYVTPIGADGAIWRVPDAGTADVSGDRAAVDAQLSRVEPGDATKEEVDAAVAQVAAAIDAARASDPQGSLAQGADEVSERAAGNAAASPAEQAAGADASAIAGTARQAATAAEQAGTPPAKVGTSSDASAPAASSGSKAPASSGRAQASSGSSSAASASGSSSASQPSKPAHQHEWEPVYEKYGVLHCAWCGYETESEEEMNNHLFSTDHGNYKVIAKKRVVGYKCATCGATK